MMVKVPTWDPPGGAKLSMKDSVNYHEELQTPPPEGCWYSSRVGGGEGPQGHRADLPQEQLSQGS